MSKLIKKKIEILVLLFSIGILSPSLYLFFACESSYQIQDEKSEENTQFSPPKMSSFLDWEITWDTYGLEERGNAVHVDKEGNIIVGGVQYLGDDIILDDIVLIKYDKNGVQLWNITWGNTTLKENFNDMVLDNNGNIYVIGQRLTLPLFEMFLVKFDKNGKELWNNTYPSINWTDGNSIAIGKDSFIYCLGENASNSLLLLKCNSFGELQWVKMHEGDDWFEEFGIEMKFDSVGNIYVLAGNHSGYVELDIQLYKFDKDGNYIWNKTWGEMNDQLGHDIIIDSEDNIYILGENKTEANPVILKYGKDGNLLWEKSIGNENDTFTEFHITLDDYIYACGFEKQIDYCNYTLAFIDKNGNELWKEVYGKCKYGRYPSIDLSYGDELNVYITGSTISGLDTNTTIFLSKIFIEDLSGPHATQDWQITTSSEIRDVLMSENFIAVLNITSDLHVYNITTGEELWMKMFPYYARMDLKKDILAIGYGEMPYGELYVYNASNGMLLWNYTFGSVLRAKISSDGQYTAVTSGEIDDKVYFFNNTPSLNKEPEWICNYAEDFTDILDISEQGGYIIAGNNTEFWYFDTDSNVPLWKANNILTNYEFYDADMTEDGRYIAVTSYDDPTYTLGYLSYYNNDTEDPKLPEWYMEEDNLFNVKISKDGLKIAYLAGKGDGYLWILDDYEGTFGYYDISFPLFKFYLEMSSNGQFVMTTTINNESLILNKEGVLIWNKTYNFRCSIDLLDSGEKFVVCSGKDIFLYTLEYSEPKSSIGNGGDDNNNDDDEEKTFLEKLLSKYFTLIVVLVITIAGVLATILYIAIKKSK